MTPRRARAGIGGCLLIATIGCGGNEPLHVSPKVSTANGGDGASGAASDAGGRSGATTGVAGGGAATEAPTGVAGGGAATGAPTGVAGATQEPAANEWIFFDALRGTNRDVYAVQPDGSALRRVTTSAANEYEPVVSPDGRTLAYTSDADHAFQIYVMALPTGAPRQLTHEADPVHQPAWSPDGARVAFISVGAQGTAVVVIDVQGTNESRVAMVGGGSGDGHPAFTIDGGSLLFDGYNFIHRVDLATRVETTVVPGFTGAAQHPSPSPDGRSFAFDNTCDGPLDGVWVDSLVEPVQTCMSGTRLTARGDFVRFPAFSRSGRQLAVEHGTGPARIGVLDGAAPLKDVTDGKGDERNPSWAPATTPVPSL
jgi:Tol biopolymer transport system component